jgi:tetratricopeptide (TPR) repeat protein
MFEEGASLVEEGVGLLRQETGQDAESKPVREGLAELSAYSMITREDQTFTVHRMVQEVLRTRIPEERRREWIELALRVVNDYSPPGPEDVRTWPVWNVLRPHAAVVVRYADEVEIAQPTALLMNQLEQFLTAKGLYDEAEPLIRRALEIDEDSFGPDHPKVAIDLNNLASLLQATNRLAEAEPLMRRVMKIMEASIGPNHPNIAVALNNLAQLLQDTNRLTEAEPLMRRVLKIDEDSFGPDHLNVAIDFSNLALLLQATSRLAEAEPLMWRAVEIFEASLGQDHPNTQAVRHNLEFLLAKMNSEGPQQE